MTSSQADYRRLYESILSDGAGAVYGRLLEPWARANAVEREWLQTFSALGEHAVPPVKIEDVWQLYALSRVMQCLLLRFQNGRVDGSDFRGPLLTLDEYVMFARSLGLTVGSEAAFSPFHHEIVEVEQAQDENQPISVTSAMWPCVMLGNLLIERAGVRISGGRRFIRKEVAESSTLYWAYWRKHRRYQDLSHGWGSNSQWRTGFRRDYLIGGMAHYNVDGGNDLSKLADDANDLNGLNRAERIELLIHRCFITTTKPHDDLCPYNDRYSMKV